MLRPRKFKELETALGHKFRSVSLLEEALTHASVRGSKTTRADNERLEFIGDRVLGLAIAEVLIAKFPKATEGELARLFNRLVRGEACAKVGRSLNLGKFVVLSDSEADSGGREKATILADAVEAVLGAVFLDGGFDKARGVVQRLWSTLADHPAEPPVDAKSALQEWAQAQGLSLPRYTVVARKGPDHAPSFTSEVQITGRAPAQGEGASKRIAEQAAAKALLEREGVDVMIPHD